MNINQQIFQKLPKNNISFITIDGISCSGKTTYAKLLKKKLTKYFPDIFILSKDLFLYPRKKRIELTKNIKDIKDINQNFLHYDHKKLKTLLNFIIGKSKKKKLILKKLYNRKNGKNDYLFKLNYSKNKLIIFEGIYVNDDIKFINKSILRILLIENVYNSLSRKIKRIRDKKISIQLLVSEYLDIHLNSYKNYLSKSTYDLFLQCTNKKFIKIKNGKTKQLKNILSFFNKHVH
jgi:uridine kinase